MAYPDNIDSFSTKVDNQDDVMANHINQVQASIVAVENELGVNPSGTDASVKSRLDRIDTGSGVQNSVKVGGYSVNTGIVANNVPVRNQSGLVVGVTNTKVYGNVVYTDSINSNSTLTKTIPLGGSYNFGQMTITNTSFTDGILGAGVFVLFDSNSNLNTKVIGSHSQGAGGASWSRRKTGRVINAYSNGNVTFGSRSASDSTYIGIDDIYINGTNLIIVFHNYNTTTAQSLNCTIDWEVWY